MSGATMSNGSDGDLRISAGFLKRQAEILVSVTIIGGALAAMIGFFGGSVPPWPSVSRFNTLDSRVDGFITTYNSQLCYDANRRLRNAEMRMASEPNSIAEQYIAEAARNEIYRITGCVER